MPILNSLKNIGVAFYSDPQDGYCGRTLTFSSSLDSVLSELFTNAQIVLQDFFILFFACFKGSKSGRKLS